MRHFFSLIVILVFVATLFADNYKILQMNTLSVRIGNREYKKDDVFSDDSIIVWTKKKQAFKAQNTKTKEIHLFTEADFKLRNSKTIREYFIKTNHLSVRATGLSLSDLSEVLNSSVFSLLDTLTFESPIPLDSTRYYYVCYKLDNNVIKKRLPSMDGRFVIVRSTLELIKPDSNGVVEFSIYFRSEDVAEDYLLSDSMRVILLPLEIAD